MAKNVSKKPGDEFGRFLYRVLDERGEEDSVNIDLMSTKQFSPDDKGSSTLNIFTLK